MSLSLDLGVVLHDTETVLSKLIMSKRRKEFRGKLAIAITANFTNKRTTAEAIVDEISGVAFVYKQDFFNNLYDEFGIALENIVYYKVGSITQIWCFTFFIFFLYISG